MIDFIKSSDIPGVETNAYDPPMTPMIKIGGLVGCHLLRYKDAAGHARCRIANSSIAYATTQGVSGMFPPVPPTSAPPPPPPPSMIAPTLPPPPPST
uniref:Uncharacterized protein n=1 Tax=Ditylenchus dipsaci TaxID=166011 RepID=A0A915DTK6_9BILA